LKTLAIIPARGGSKGVPRKNVRLVAGQPLITYAIQAAQQSAQLTAFVVTTDSEEIASVARDAGAFTLLRPPELAQDATPMLPVVIHAIEQMEQATNQCFDTVILMQPTSPIRTGKNVDDVVAMLEADETVDGVISVCPMDDTHPARMYTLENDWMSPLWADWETMQRQKLPVVYYRNGAFYAVRRAVLFKQQTLMPSRKKAYVMPREWLANIDDERDLLIADALVRHWKQENGGEVGHDAA
jgi:CMP-N,N'-diacetyllegionaminic acid synthase